MTVELLAALREGHSDRTIEIDIRRRAAAKIEQLQNLLRRIKQWDHLGGASDGPYWQREIDKALEQ